jgi:hypothetical protein
MTDYRVGYESYKEACEHHNLEPVNFHYYIINLSQDQLDAFNNHAKQNRGQHELTT